MDNREWHTRHAAMIILKYILTQGDSVGNDFNYVLTHVESLAAEVPEPLSLLHYLYEGSELCEGRLLHN